MPAPVLPTAVPSLLAVANQERARSFSWSLAVRAVWRNTTTLMTPMAAPSHQHEGDSEGGGVDHCGQD